MARVENALVRNLPRAERMRLLARREPVHLALSQVRVEAEAPASQVLFPVRSFFSPVLQAPGHAGIEVGMVGGEGAIGATWALGAVASPVRSVVQGAGSAWRPGRVHFVRELQASQPRRQLVQRYLDVTLVQLGAASACRCFPSARPAPRAV